MTARTAKRNGDIVYDFKGGMTISDLAYWYKLTIKSIQKIIRTHMRKKKARAK